MTPMITLLGERMRALLVERRRFARRKAALPVKLPVGVSVPNEKLDPEADEYPLPILGQTRDLSETGLSLLLPTLDLGREQINAANFPLRLVLSLPGGIAVVQANAVRADEVLTPEGERGFVVGARITKMNERDRKRYLALLNSLS